MKNEVEDAVSLVCKELYSTKIKAELVRPEENFGDYSTNVALQLGDKLNRNPREIAEEIAQKLRDGLSEFTEKVDIAGPGFINLRLSSSAVLTALYEEPKKVLKDQSIVAEYSDPNPFKVLHAGHLYTTIVGDSVTRIIEAAGANVHRLNYGGDVGLHVAKTMWAIIHRLGGEQADKLNEIDDADRLGWLSECYIEGNLEYDKDKNAKEEIIAINKRVYDIHESNDHETQFARIYWTCREWSYEGFKKLYDRLNVKSFERYIAESEVIPLGLELVQKGLKDGNFKKSGEAVVFDGEQYSLHTRVFINSERLPTYEAKELGLATLKWQEYKFAKSIIITANDIVEYMKVVMKALEHFSPEIVARTEHLTHGNIKLPAGKKMSSREGNILRAEDILEAASKANLLQNRQENYETALGAVKYSFLKSRLGGDIIFYPEQSVSLEGNSGPYLQYSHARARSIISKAPNSKTNDEPVFDDEERSMARKISEYVEIFDKAVNELRPHYICNYLYELAQKFNNFYEHNRVIGDPREAIRLTLVERYAVVLKQGLGLLGISAADRM